MLMVRSLHLWRSWLQSCGCLPGGLCAGACGRAEPPEGTREGRELNLQQKSRPACAQPSIQDGAVSDRTFAAGEGMHMCLGWGHKWVSAGTCSKRATASNDMYWTACLPRE